MKLLLSLLLTAPILLLLPGCGCGFNCNGGGNDDRATLTLGFSDALPEDLKEVVIKVDSITFRRAGADDVVVENFTIPELSLQDAPDFQVNLLNYRGLKQLPVIQNLEIEPGTYNEVTIKVIGGNIENSFVLERESDRQKVLNVPGGSLALKNLRVTRGAQTVTVEFSLAQALDFLPITDTYQLNTTGLRLENNAQAASLSGQIDSALFNTVSPCSEKEDPLSGNRIYLYADRELATESLVDVYTDASTEQPPSGAVAPFAVASLLAVEETNTWVYSFGFVPAGEYTMAFSCDTANDNAIQWNALTVPLPDKQVYSISLKEGEAFECNISSTGNCTSTL